MQRHLAAILVIAMVALLSTTAQAQLEVQLSGGRDTLWLTAWDSQAKTLDVRLRTKDQWERTDPDHPNAPVAAQCATEYELHLFLASGVHYLFDSQQPKMGQVGLWPPEWESARPLASADGPDRGGRQILYLMLDIEEPSPATAPAPETPAEEVPAAKKSKKPSATSPASRTGSKAPAAPVEQPARPHTLFRGPVIYTFDQQWKRLAEYPARLLPADTNYHLAVAGQDLYVLACSPEGQPLRLSRRREGQWSDLWDSNSIEWPLEKGQVLSLLSTPEALFLAGAVGDDGARTPALWRLRPDGSIVPEPTRIQQGGKDVTLAAGSSPAFAEYGGNVALAYLQGKVWTVATVGLNGQVLNSGVVDLAASPEGSDQAMAVFQYMLVGLAMLMIVLSFYRQRQAITRPFVLPPQLVPSMWIKRLISAGIEFMAIFFPVCVAFGLSELTPEERNSIVNQANHGVLYTPLLMAYLVTMGLYVAYSIIMESLFGATLAKMVFNLRVVGSGGLRPTLASVALRNVSKLVEFNGGQAILTLVFLVWPLFSRYRQRFGDIIAATAVVDRRLRADHLFPSEPPSPPPGGPGFPTDEPSPPKRSDDDKNDEWRA